ncbi:phytanoyl-CoA dioxygenase family protein [Paracraurococcus lichenis]|uniref:Phytanoyl-CoA dioxygenase family protein n=1 Tax=Paracraurococcus lichenis TaxID=3064888 RepID=A0ABT9E0M4_9PROT|nr:phytanoyl-CoA dioxygenase family protein [Paracraurococcus sp. LOR1-02]MDO9709718.1 phytanoyl-CoA dioxygenase family protein [Paracraurococcus sp. LOR1-02]
MNKPITRLEVDYGPEQAAMQAYLREGERRAFALGNRGPIRFGTDGRIHPDILEAYWRCGFYVFEGVLGAEELADIEADIHAIQDRLPSERGSPVDAKGRPALAADCEAPVLFWSRPLGDPMGGTQAANGRHPVKMFEPRASEDAPKEIVYLILGTLQFSEAHLRLYGHPGLLAMAAAVNGDDFVPFNEAIFIKEPGRGASVAWHQDGVTHWESPDLDAGSHGFNFMAQLYGCTAANGVWVVPGSHRRGRADIRAMVAAAGTERLPEAVPIICRPGDVAITNRQTVHGSFANTSPDWRVTLNFGFHRRRSVLGVTGGGVHNAPAVYDEARIRERARVIGYAIDARRRRFPAETPHVYRPHAEAGETWRWDAAAKAGMKDYNLLDLSI